MFDVRFFVGSK